MTVAVAVAVQRIPPPLLAEVRAACAALGLVVEEWAGGIPRTSPMLVITALEAGERRLPDELCQLIDASPGIRALVCASEPLVKPRISLGSGRVVLLAPPVDRVRLIAVLRATIGADERSPVREAGSRRFELLRRQYWVAWARGADGTTVNLNEQSGLTVAIGPSGIVGPVTRTLNENISEAKRADKLVERLGNSGAVVHLLEDAAEWLIYWPAPQCPIWISSPQRLPTRWSAAKALGAAGQNLIRVPAFPGDQIVGAWSPDAVVDDVFGPVREGLLEGGPETLANLATATDRMSSLTGVVVELR